ncbi:unnamed protein product [Brassicogethes aeneus]|uniref:Protein glass n=1 Tax=Brassicogethes aeneus TaxID=1431903 RepID=A0A9P0FIP1_BRAAE|nr:unnamed protein product [Brassicogethes aeneus]
MDAASYVPNNPQFGLQLECNWSTQQQQQQLQQQQQQHQSQIATVNGSCAQDDLSSCWSDDMGSFSLPLDLEPLPSLFNISPCGSNGYKTESQGTYQNQPSQLIFRENKPTGDVADVLLSLKHAVVHPGQSPSDKYESQQNLHHSQMLLSPGSAYGGICDQAFAQQTPMFPSMSVNVSMNMTMHGYHPNSGYPSGDIACPQVQWSASPQVPNPSAYQSQGLLSPSYGGTTYSFTADFRPPQEAPVISSSNYKPVQMSFSSPRRRHSIALMEDDCQKPNVCRICGKSYARPSTLKTHLRTHSGEKPYRCIDCNKSFSQAANLTAHVRTHSGEKPFRCPVCDRRFSQSSSVTTHMRTHSGERPYRCRLCKKAFSDSSTLTKHLRIHSGEKPYECKLCLLRFSQSGNLNRHMRVHGTGNGMPP